MIFFKGFLKYCVYLFLAAWMFFLGILVGRDNSPVKFDTRKFQKRLEVIAHDFGAKKKIPKKIDLKFYKVLDRPESEEAGEIYPKKEVLISELIPLKTSKKKETFKTGKVETRKIEDKKQKSQDKTKQVMAKKRVKIVKPDNESRNKSGTQKGRYTVQIAAFKDFKDSVNQMAVLQEKGFSSYRIKGLKDGKTWYRVRSGSFSNFDEAAGFKKKLEEYKINSLIIKSD